MISIRTVAGSKHWLSGLLLLLVLNLLTATAHAAAKPKLAFKAGWSAKQNTLTIKGTLKNAPGHEPVEILDTNGRRLGLATGDSFNLTLKGQDLPSIPCTVRAQSGSLETLVKVGGAPKSCASPAPTCQILSPVNGAALQAHETVSFQAKTLQKNKKAGPLKIEWDFAGGVMQTTAQRQSTQAAGSHHTDATFVRDNSRYRVRFIATDGQNRRCEDSIDIAIGNPPAAADLPNMAPLAQAAQQSQPKLGSGLQGQYVVMPFEKRSMQNGHEAELMPKDNQSTPDNAAPPQYNTINAYVYQKGLRPVLQDDNSVQLTYSAASNVADPVGANAINSTSQNYPAGSTYAAATLKKGELWEVNQRPPEIQLPEGYSAVSLIDMMSGVKSASLLQTMHVPEADEGAYKTGLVNSDHGRYMPGIAAPYTANAPQDFSAFDSGNYWFSAYWLPLTHINDSGRVSPTSLFRVLAVDKDSQQPLATTDATLTAGKDFHCRECHTLGKIGANPDIARKNGAGVEISPMLMAAKSDSIEDQEAAALNNMASVHLFDRGMANMNGLGDKPSVGCASPNMCHSAGPTVDNPEFNQLNEGGHTTRPGTSESMHRMHGLLQYNADKTDILRNDFGKYACYLNDYKNLCDTDPTKVLFPVKDADGNILPMEQNCLKCHGGQREQCYRDRMYTAGVTCYQCHGDMLAVSTAYAKRQRHPDDNTYRVPWLEQPECGSCHIGSGNVGKAANNGFFSAGVKSLAFAADDPAATPNAVDWTNADQRRFAVPLSELPNVGYNDRANTYNTNLTTPLFRLGKDSHGLVGCPACHGPAHGIWPNRDPNANDNVTALELQGHTGSVLDCNVCHLPDSFAEQGNLDEGHLVTDAKPYVLGGPHNLHPINDPNWWLHATGDKPKDNANSDGSTSGGWHNNYAKQPGHDNEDQCAACHGNDHKGTRLSKTPVDRVFDFSKQPDWKLLKKAGIKAKVTVPAGTPIGCDTCHSIPLSCTASPAAAQCGQASEHVTGSDNQAPSFSPDSIDVNIGEYPSVQLTLTDPEGDTPGVALARPDIDGGSLAVDPSGMVTIYNTGTWVGQFFTYVPDPKDPTIYQRPPFKQVIPLLVSDDRGAQALRDLTVNLVCPAGSVFDFGYCAPVTIYSIAPTGGLDSSSTPWTYQLKAEAGNGNPLQYSLQDPVPPGMSIDQQGLIHWQTDQVLVNSDQTATVQVQAQDSDGNVNQTSQSFMLTVCVPPMHWRSDANGSGCVGTVHITSTPPLTTNANQFSYKVTASEEQNRPVTYSLIDAPTGFQIDQDGLITGVPYKSTLGAPAYNMNFSVQVAVAPDNWVRQFVGTGVCSGAMRNINPALDFEISCTDYGPITPISPPDYTVVSAGQPYSYQFDWPNSNNNLPRTYTLLGAQPGMSIDGASGVFSWDTRAYAGQFVSFGILAEDGTDNGWGASPIYLSVCPGETPLYVLDQGGCIAGPIQFSSIPDFGASYNNVYTYQAATNDTNTSDGSTPLPVSYALSGAPAGASIDASGLLTLDTTGLGDAVEMKQLAFGIIATDAQGAWTQQQVYLNLCPQATPTWDPNQYMCVP